MKKPDETKLHDLAQQVWDDADQKRYELDSLILQRDIGRLNLAASKLSVKVLRQRNRADAAEAEVSALTLQRERLRGWLAANHYEKQWTQRVLNQMDELEAKR